MKNERKELNTHTKISPIDGIRSDEDLLRQTDEYVYKAVDITDHGMMQAFHESQNVSLQTEQVGMPVKFIYSMGTDYQNNLPVTLKNCKEQLLTDPFVIVDIETTGLSAITSEIIEISAVRTRNGCIEDTFHSYIKPHKPIPENISQLCGITSSMVEDAPFIENAICDFLNFCGTDPLVAFHADYCIAFLYTAAQRIKKKWNSTLLDMRSLCTVLHPYSPNYCIKRTAQNFHIEVSDENTLTDNLIITAKIFFKLCSMLQKNEIVKLRPKSRYMV